MQGLYNILRDSSWQTYASIVGLGALIAVVIDFFHPVSSQDPMKKKIKRAFIIIVSTLLIIGVITASIAFGPKSPDSATPPSSLEGFAPPSSWQLILNDPLTASSHASPWENDSGCIFLSNAYKINSYGPNYCAYGDSQQDHFTDLAFSAVLSIKRGELGGLVFRLMHGNYYAFCVTTKGFYQILKHSGGNDTSIATSFSPFIQQGLDKNNTLAVIAQGNVLHFWINGHIVSSNYDSTYTAGTIAFIVGSDQNSTLSATFHNAQVWVPPT